jgi:DNA-directed RNA polymerase subunit RPC12/RpoP
MIVKRCATCSRIRAYEDDDAFCLGCGIDSLESACECGRAYDYALTEPGDELHCPRCGRRLRGRATGIE